MIEGYDTQGIHLETNKDYPSCISGVIPFIQTFEITWSKRDFFLLLSMGAAFVMYKLMICENPFSSKNLFQFISSNGRPLILKTNSVRDRCFIRTPIMTQDDPEVCFHVPAVVPLFHYGRSILTPDSTSRSVNIGSL